MTKINKYKKTDGTTAYMFNAYVGKNSKGKKTYRKRQGFKTKKQAQIALADLLKDIEANGLEKKQTVITFRELYDLWLAQHRMNVKESSIETMNSYLRSQILPVFGDMKLNAITVIFCQKVVNKWYNSGLKSYKNLRKLTSQIFHYGETMEIIPSNPMAKTILPKKKETEQKLKYLTKQQLEYFFECLKRNKCYKQIAVFRLLAFTGARKSELLALQWKDIDLVNKTITIGRTVARGERGRLVVQTPKTSSSQRTISVDDETVRIMTNWRTIQRSEYLQMGFNTSSNDQYVFTNEKNTLLRGGEVNNWLKKVIAENDLPVITPHHFRHTHASLLLQAGVPVKEVSERLGHKDIKITLEIYSHVMPEEAEKTANKFANFVGF